MSHHGKREMDADAGPSSKRVRRVELPIREADARGTMQLARKYNLKDDKKPAGNDSNSSEYSDHEIVQKMLSDQGEEAMNLSPAVMDLVKKLAATKITPHKLAGAVLECRNFKDSKVYMASAISRLEEQRKEQGEAMNHIDGEVTSLTHYSYQRIRRLEKKFERKERRDRLWQSAMEARLLSASDRQSLAKEMEEFDKTPDPQSDDEVEFEQVLGITNPYLK
ncbi:hypothetical protein V8F20_008636 [Naviculisporaceae sp. PSN 640]